MRNIESTGIKVKEQKLYLLDQCQLPHKEHWLLCDSVATMVEAIQKLKIRGAPLIGVGAGLLVAYLCHKQENSATVANAIQTLRVARPTAVNLSYCLDRLEEKLPLANWREEVINLAYEIFEQDVALCLSMAQHGEALIAQQDRVLTHCNAGALATAGVGTAVGVITQAWKQRKSIHVWVSETRPLLQGSRLTAWEMEKAGIPFQIICDNMVGSLMAQNKINKIFVGADRIAANGDFANKIGTYNLAVLAGHHRVPFYVVAPKTTVDSQCAGGEDIPIEQRSAQEVKGVSGSFGEVQWSQKNANAYNPAFDVTPANLVSAWVLDSGVYTAEQVKSGVLHNL